MIQSDRSINHNLEDIKTYYNKSEWLNLVGKDIEIKIDNYIFKGYLGKVDVENDELRLIFKNVRIKYAFVGLKL
jgi:hypothetical protein